MNNVRHFRAMGSLCRQQAANNPDQRWNLLAKAEHWEHLAAAELAFHFKECNADRSVYSTDTLNPRNVNGSRWKTIVAA